MNNIDKNKYILEYILTGCNNYYKFNKDYKEGNDLFRINYNKSDDKVNLSIERLIDNSYYKTIYNCDFKSSDGHTPDEVVYFSAIKSIFENYVK